MSPESQVIKLRGLKQLGHQTGWMAMKVGRGVCTHHLYVCVCDVCVRERKKKVATFETLAPCIYGPCSKSIKFITVEPVITLEAGSRRGLRCILASQPERH
jgi:hypothetical protein